jgi:Family of unknown function (DUF5906)/Bifunctional DNA primase/polymerase, N-terminal
MQQGEPYHSGGQIGQPQAVVALRRALVAAGYTPLPLHGKAPPVFGKNGAKKGLGGWQNLEGVTPEQIDGWGRDWPDAVNTGVLTKHTPALDIDILNEDAARACEELVCAQFEERGAVPVRIGKPPKRACLFRTEQPFAKILIIVTAPNGSAEKLEFLGNGQQLVVAGIHPETKQPYRWHGGEPGQVRREDLPEISADEARSLIEDLAELLVRDFGYTRAMKRKRVKDARAGSDSSDWADLLTNINAGQALHDSLRDLAAKLIRSGTSPGAAVNQLRAMMEASSAPRDDRFRDRMREIPRLVDSAIEKFAEMAEDATLAEGARLEDFLAYMPQRSAYFFTPSRELWPGTSVDARLPPVPGPAGKPIKPSAWLAANAAVEQTTWAPGEPMLIKDKLVSDGGWIKRPGCRIFNQYRPPTLVPKAGDVTPWLDLVHKIFPGEADHIVLWLAQRVQRAWEKINHALFLGGNPGIGKDTILEPVKQAIGPWNFADVSPHRVLGSFNSYARSVILRISEARDLGDWDRFAFYDRMKALIAAPPDVIQINEKHLREYYVPNLCGVVITSNHKTDGIYLPAEDRRHLVTWSNLTQNDFTGDYWQKLYRWYGSGGNAAVAEFLLSRDLSGFDAKAPPPKTGAFWEIVNANRAPEDAELADVLDELGRPDVVMLDRVASQASLLQPAFAEWLRDAKANARRIPHRFEDCGYVAVRNPNDSEGRWKISGRRHTIYGKASLSERERLAAALKFTGAR